MSQGDLTSEDVSNVHSRSDSFDSDNALDGNRPLHKELVRAMYGSDGHTDGVSVVFEAGDIFRVVQRPGDGWVDVLMKNRTRAFVPESWVETVSAAEVAASRKRGSLASQSALSEDQPSEMSVHSATSADDVASSTNSQSSSHGRHHHHRRTPSHALGGDLDDVLEDVPSGATDSSSAAHIAAKEGPLDRKVLVEGGKKLKKRGWVGLHAVLSTSGHLNLYKEEKDVRKGRKPVHSLHLAEGGISAKKTEHKKRKSVLHVGNDSDNFMLHTSSEAELQAWLDLFALACGGTLPLEAAPTASADAPAAETKRRSSVDLVPGALRTRSNSDKAFKDTEKAKEKEKEKAEKAEKKERKEREKAEKLEKEKAEKAEKEREKEREKEEKRKRKSSSTAAPVPEELSGNAPPATPTEKGHTRNPSTHMRTPSVHGHTRTPSQSNPAVDMAGANGATKVSNFKWLGNFLKARPKLEDLKKKGLIQNTVFGAELSEQVRREGEDVPIIVRKCVEYVETKAMDVVGIYRLSANASLVQKTAVLFNEDSSKVDLSTIPDPHAVTAILKQYFRELADPVFTDILYPRFMEVGHITDYSERLAATRTVVISLPQIYYTTVKFIFEHLRRVADHGDVNKMHANNLAIVFGPTLLRPMVATPASLIQETPYQCRIVEEMITNQQWFFN
eukprot:Opistho-1_new@55392